MRECCLMRMVSWCGKETTDAGMGKPSSYTSGCAPHPPTPHSPFASVLDWVRVGADVIRRLCKLRRGNRLRRSRSRTNSLVNDGGRSGQFEPAPAGTPSSPYGMFGERDDRAFGSGGNALSRLSRLICGRRRSDFWDPLRLLGPLLPVLLPAPTP